MKNDYKIVKHLKFKLSNVLRLGKYLLKTKSLWSGRYFQFKHEIVDVASLAMSLLKSKKFLLALKFYFFFVF